MFGPPRVPEWAKFMTAREYESFTREVLFTLRRTNPALDAAAGVVALDVPGEGRIRAGLLNIAQLYHSAEAEERRGMVASHFRTLLDGKRSEQLEQLEDNFEIARTFLKVRIQPDDYLPPELADKLVWWPYSDGLCKVLVFDFPDSTATVKLEVTRKWNVSPQDLLETAIANVKRESVLKGESVEVRNGAFVEAFLGDSFFTTSHVLFLEHYLPPGNRAGAIVGLPHRHAMLLHPICDANAVHALLGMIPMTRGMFEEGPGSISPSVYWWRDGNLRVIPSRIEKKSVTVEPPEEFIDLLDSLKKPGE